MIYHEVIGFIKSEIKQQGISKKQLAEELGYTPAAISRWLDGDRKMPYMAVNSALCILGYDLEIVSKKR